MLNSEPDPALLAAMRLTYQPIIRLDDAEISHAEVLAREARANGEIFGPQAIIGAMADPAQALPVTLAIMRRALAEYRAYGFAASGLALAFNLPLDALLNPELVPALPALCREAGLPPAKIRFELTETSPVQNFAAAAAGINALHLAGHDLALDDISPHTPYLDALMTLPIHAIKFSNTLTADPTTLPFIQALAHRARSRGQHAIAEGIETPTQLSTMRQAGITHGQGYLFCHPIPASTLAGRLRGEG